MFILTRFQWEGGPCILATAPKKKRQLRKFCVSVSRMSAPSTRSMASVNTTPRGLPESLQEKSIPLWAPAATMTSERTASRVVVLEARLLKGRLLPAGQSDLSLSWEAQESSVNYLDTRTQQGGSPACEASLWPHWRNLVRFPAFWML